MNTPTGNTLNHLPRDADVESPARAIFHAACDNTDSYHALRLATARRKALDCAAARPAFRLWAPLAGAAMACCALAVGVVMMRPVPPASVPANAPSAATITLAQPEATDELPAVGSNQMEMVQDLDFYRWLATQPGVVTATAGGSR